MRLTTTKKIQIFSNGSLNFDTTIIKRLKKISFFNKDHINFTLNKTNSDTLINQQDLKNFKAKYLKTR